MKFKVGDIVRTDNKNKWPVLIRIEALRLANDPFEETMYEATVLEVNPYAEDYTNMVGKAHHFRARVVDSQWYLDTEYLTKQKFDDELKELLK